MQLLFGVARVQSPRISGPEIAPLLLRNDAHEVFPEIGEESRCPFLIEPVELMLARSKNPPQDELADPLGMRLGICERQGGAPGPAEKLPLLDAGDSPQALHVLHQMPGRVRLQAGVRRRTSAPSLIEQEHVIFLGMKEAAVGRRDPAAGPAMDEERWLCSGFPRAFEIEDMAVANIQMTRLIRLDRWIQCPQVGGLFSHVLARSCRQFAV